MQASCRYRDPPPGVEEGVPLHLWVIGLLSFAWNAFGAFDYAMINLHDADYRAGLTPQVLAMIDQMPPWARAGWALGVWGALLGSVLLLARTHHAFVSFAVSLFGLAASTIWQQKVGLPAVPAFPALAWTSGAIWAIAVALTLYSRRMVKSGILR